MGKHADLEEPVSNPPILAVYQRVSSSVNEKGMLRDKFDRSIDVIPLRQLLQLSCLQPCEGLPRDRQGRDPRHVGVPSASRPVFSNGE